MARAEAGRRRNQTARNAADISAIDIAHCPMGDSLEEEKEPR